MIAASSTVDMERFSIGPTNYSRAPGVVDVGELKARVLFVATLRQEPLPQLSIRENFDLDAMSLAWVLSVSVSTGNAVASAN